MKLCYPLKKAQPANLVQSIVSFLERDQTLQLAQECRDSLQKIDQLRNKVTQLQLPSDPTLDQLNKYIPAVEMYVKYALILANRLNWNSDYGITVQDLKLVWHDAFNTGYTFMKGEIHFDIFCCFYNLGVMYFYKANILCGEDLINSRKESIRAAKIAFYLFNQARTVYYPVYANTGFTDCNHANLQMLELLTQGIIYKNLFNLFKEDQFKLGINNIASIAGEAQKRFFNAYQIGVQFFMKTSAISANLKSEVLSFSYVEALYHDAMFNTKYAKYYKDRVEDQHQEDMIYLIAYERKALRFLQLGLKNQSVKHLLDSRPEQRKDLENILPQIRESLDKNVLRNKEIYKKKQIKEEQLPPPMQTPKKYIAEPIQPQNIKVNYDNPVAAPFKKLIDNESKRFMAQIKEFGQNRKLGLEAAQGKLSKNIQTIFNDCFVNYYLNLQNSNQKTALPQNLRRIIQMIQNNGGKKKLDLEISIIKKNDQQIRSSFKEMFGMIQKQEANDMQKRNQYQNRWNRPPSNMVNRSYVNQIQVYQKKAQQASTVNQKIIDKYHNLQKYIKVVDQSQETIAKSLPKVQVTKFLQENQKQFQQLRKGTQKLKHSQDQLQNLADDIKRFFEKIDYNEEANKYYKEVQMGNKEKVFEKIFGQAYKMIEKFNSMAKDVENQAKKVGDISTNLNKKNKGDQKSKKEFEDAASRFNDTNNLFRDLAQGTGFYTKINEILSKIYSDLQGFLAAREMQAKQLEESIKRGGFGAGQNLPSMYPNQQPQQNLGFYIPPPMQFSGHQQQGPQFNNQNSNMGDMLSDILRSKPNFGGDVFGGPVYQSKFK